MELDKIGELYGERVGPSKLFPFQNIRKKIIRLLSVDGLTFMYDVQHAYPALSPELLDSEIGSSWIEGTSSNTPMAMPQLRFAICAKHRTYLTSEHPSFFIIIIIIIIEYRTTW